MLMTTSYGRFNFNLGLIRFLRCPCFHVSTLFLHNIYCRHRRSQDDGMSGGTGCCFGLLFLIAQVLLHGVIILTLYWVINFRWKDDQGFPFAWSGTGAVDREKQWNLHPVLMVTGFIYCMGQGTLSMTNILY